MADIITTDYSSVYTLKEFIQKHLLPLYFDSDKLSLSTVGDLGLFLDISGTTTEDMINIMGRYINESMPGRANLPDFIYANAANYGISDILAKPSKLSLLLFIKESDVIKYAKVVNGHKEFVLDSEMSILIDDLRFSIPYDIKIRSNLINGSYNHMSFYDINHNNAIASEGVPYIKTAKTRIYGDVWLVLRVNAYQYTRLTYNETINTNSILNIPYIDVRYSNQLCNFEVFYTPPNSTKEIQLIKRMDTSLPLTDPFVFYKLIDDGTLRLSFANDDRFFLPDYNSSIKVFMYETEGDAGNFGFFQKGIDVSIRAQTSNEDIGYNRKIFPMGSTQGSATGGRDQLTLDNLKRLTTEAQVTVKSYTTDNDLNKHFIDFASIYHHDAIFIKQRDDYVGRQYGCFTRFNDGKNIFPTNTLDVRLSTSDIDTHFQSLRQYIIKPGTRFQYEDDTTTSVVVRKPDGAEDDEIEYALAPLMIITTKPNQVRYYMNTVSHIIQLDYTYFNLNSLFNFISDKFSIVRNAIQGEDEYTLTLSIRRVDGVFTDAEAANFEVQSANGTIDTDRLKVIIVFETNMGNYIPMELIEDDGTTYTFQAKLKTTDMIDNERILITNLLRRADDVNDERLIDIINHNIQIGVFYEYENSTNGDHQFSDISLVQNATLCNTYTPQENEFYLAFPLNLMRSHVIFEDKPTSRDGFGFYVKQVPFFGADFLLSKDNNIEDVLTYIANEHEFLTNIVQELHGMFTINMKFFCTYGKGRTFYISYGKSDEIINHVNCTFSIGIKFYEGIIVDDYLETVRYFIKDYFEKVNKLENGTNQAYISKLSHALHEEYRDQIEYVLFYSINGYDSKYQIIHMKTNLEEMSDVDFIPEYLTLKADDISITVL